jgi:hypothetical protein
MSQCIPSTTIIKKEKNSISTAGRVAQAVKAA